MPIYPEHPAFWGGGAPLWWVYRMVDDITGASGGHARDPEWLEIMVPRYVIVRQWDFDRN